MKRIVAGIHTGIGKTVCSAVLCEALAADYWKPVQAGDEGNTDSDQVRKLTGASTRIFPERYKLSSPVSPHLAAEREGLHIRPGDFVLPDSDRLIVELAGGLLSPLANDYLNLDLVINLGLPVILVSQNYLGSINHTLLSVSALRHAKVEIEGLVFCGRKDEASEHMITTYTRLPVLVRIPWFDTLDTASVSAFAKSMIQPEAWKQ